MDSTAVLQDIDARGVATLTLNRPELHNAFDDVLIRDLTLALKALDENEGVRLIVLRANGKSFSAGADLNWMKRMSTYSWTQNYQDSLGLATLMQTLAHLTTPSLAIVQGAAFGGGVGLVSCCDTVFAADTASFCLSEVKLGLIPAVISPYVIAAIGTRAARRYFVSAERFDAQTALRLGLVHELCAPEALNDAAEKFVSGLLANGPKAVQEAKRLITKVAGKSIDEDLIRFTAQKIADLRASPEGREGVGAFLEKRAANWNLPHSTDIE